MSLEDAIVARNQLNGHEVSGCMMKIGFAKVPSKAEPILSVPQALANPTVLAGLATAAMDRLSITGTWKNADKGAGTLF